MTVPLKGYEGGMICEGMVGKQREGIGWEGEWLLTLVLEETIEKEHGVASGGKGRWPIKGWNPRRYCRPRGWASPSACITSPYIYTLKIENKPEKFFQLQKIWIVGQLSPPAQWSSSAESSRAWLSAAGPLRKLSAKFLYWGVPTKTVHMAQ